MESVTRFITHTLKLKVNQAKSAVARPQERTFLGFSFSAGPKVARIIAPKALGRFKQRIREITRRAKGVSMKTTMAALAPYMRGWRNYFGFCETPEVLMALTCPVTSRGVLAEPIEPPCTDPYARWCGRGRRATADPMPINDPSSIRNFRRMIRSCVTLRVSHDQSTVSLLVSQTLRGPVGGRDSNRPVLRLLAQRRHADGEDVEAVA